MKGGSMALCEYGPNADLMREIAEEATERQLAEQAEAAASQDQSVEQERQPVESESAD